MNQSEFKNSMGYEVRIFNKDNYHQLSSLYQQQANATDTNTQERRFWWCFQNPNGGAFGVILLNNQIVSTCYLSGKSIRLDGKDALVYEIGESATAANHQRKGLFSQLARELTKFANNFGASNIYGTPNKIAAPGWIKIGYTNTVVKNNYLLLIPNLTYWLLPKGNLPRSNSHLGKYEITSDAYIQKTNSFPRLNNSTPAYMKWRFTDSPRSYKYFRLLTSDQEFVCVARKGMLGRHPVVVITEHYLAGKKASIRNLAPLLRRVISGSFTKSNFAGIYVLTEIPLKFNRASQIINRAIVHRDFPVCVQKADISRGELFAPQIFQLSDCDIG